MGDLWIHLRLPRPRQMYLSTLAQVRVDGHKDVVGIDPASDHLAIQRSQRMQQANLLRQFGLQLLSLLWCHSYPGRFDLNGRYRHDEWTWNSLASRPAALDMKQACHSG